MVALKLLNVYLSVDVSIQECDLHIHLDHRVFPNSCYNQQHSCCGVITHRGDVGISPPLQFEQSLSL